MSIFSRSAPQMGLTCDPAQIADSSEGATESLIDNASGDIAPTGEAALEDLGGNAEGEANTTLEQDTAGALKVPVRRLGKTHALFARLMSSAKLDRRSAELQNHLGELKLIENFSQVALEHHLSAPVVAAFHATPGFAQAIRNFPATDAFDVIPHHPTDANMVAGLESLTSSSINLGVSIKDKTGAVVNEFNNLLDGLSPMVETLMEQVRDDRVALESSDLTDDVVATLPVMSLTNTALNEMLTRLDEHLKAIGVFDVAELRANPEKIADEVASLKQVVEQVGETFGLSLGVYGLSLTDKAEAYEPTAGSFADKDMSKASLGLLLAKAEGVLDVLKLIAEHKDDIQASTLSAVSEMPEQMAGNDVHYGGTDHATLLGSYVTLTSTVMREAVATVSMVLSTVDAALDIDDGANIPA